MVRPRAVDGAAAVTPTTAAAAAIAKKWRKMLLQYNFFPHNTDRGRIVGVHYINAAAAVVFGCNNNKNNTQEIWLTTWNL